MVKIKFIVIIACLILETQSSVLTQTISKVMSSMNKMFEEFSILENKKIVQSQLFPVINSLVEKWLPTPPLPQLPQDVNWGDNSRTSYDTSIRPFRVAFNSERIDKLLFQLNNRNKFTDPLRNSSMTYGMNTEFLNKVLDYWLTKYDFKAREKRLNLFPQFRINIQGLDIHYIHIKPIESGKKVVPILMLHGWPLTNMEYVYVYPRIMENREQYDFTFEIVAPSIPGFGYSEGTSKIGLTPYQVGIIFKNLMSRLGFEKFYIHGGDFGQYIGADMMTLYQDDVLGLHTNYPYSFLPKTLVKYALGGLFPPAVVEPRYADRLYPISATLKFILNEFGYFHMQATKPDTVGVGLIDSPSGLASWILTCIVWATNSNNDYYPDGRLLQSFELDDLLDILTITWDTESITTSMRLYAEFTSYSRDSNILNILWNPTKAPYAAIKFRHELIYQPDNFLRDKYPNLVHSKTLDFGGHFAALENPNILANDIWEGVQKMIVFNNRNK